MVEAAAVVSADVPCVALGTLSLLAAHAARRRPAWGLAAGVLLACALLTKLLAAPFAVALAVGALTDPPPRRAVAWFAGGMGLVAAALAIAYADVLGRLWDGAVGLHLQARDVDVRFPETSMVVAVVLIVLAYLGLIAVLAAGLLELPRARVRARARERADLLALLAAGFAMCAIQRPLLNHHLVIVAWPLALLAGSSLPASLRPRALALVALGAALVLPWTVHGRDTVPAGERERLATVAAAVARATAPGDQVVSDLPVVTLLAGRPAAPATVDPSYVRVQAGQLPLATIVRAAGAARAAVVGRAFRDLPGLDAAPARRFAERRSFDGIDVWTAPRAPAAG